MALDTVIQDGTSGVKLGVNADNEAKVALTTDESKAGFAVVCGEAHDGAAGVARVVRPIDVSPNFRLRAGVDVSMWSDMPGMGTTVPLPSKYQTNASVFTQASSNGWLVINSANNVASNSYTRIQTYAQFSVPPSGGMYVNIPFSISAIPAAGQVARFGSLTQSLSATADATDGAYIELTSGGVWQGVLQNSGSGSAQAEALTGFTPVVNKGHLALIVLSQYSADYYIDGILYASIPRATNAAEIVGF